MVTSARNRPTPPSHLTRRARALWRQICETYDLEAHQLEVLRRLCEASDRCDEARVVVAAEGLTVTDRYGQCKPHPAVNIERDARLAVARLVRELALDEDVVADARPPRLRRAV